MSKTARTFGAWRAVSLAALLLLTGTRGFAEVFRYDVTGRFGPNAETNGLSAPNAAFELVTDFATNDILATFPKGFLTLTRGSAYTLNGHPVESPSTDLEFSRGVTDPTFSPLISLFNPQSGTETRLDFEVFTDVLFTGAVTSPTMLTGTFPAAGDASAVDLDTNARWDISAGLVRVSVVPEGAGLALVAAASLGAVSLWAFRRRPRHA